MTDFTDAMWDAFHTYAVSEGMMFGTPNYREAQDTWEEAWFSCRDYLEAKE